MLVSKANCPQPDFAKQGGLVAVIVEEYKKNRLGKVLMLAYGNERSHRLTTETGFAHFWSRSRKKLWKKGEESGNFLPVKQIWLDCDQDTLLYLVASPGTVCHLGTSDCFVKVAEEEFLTKEE